MAKSNPGILLKQLVPETKAKLESITESESLLRATPDKWSKRELIGHLIDSCINNHHRFIIAQTKDDMNFEGYDQEYWVKVHDYHSRSWLELLDHWFSCNINMSAAICNIPGNILEKEHSNHNLEYIGWKTVPASEPTTLWYLIMDYIGHMEHHIRQIIPDYQPKVIGTY